MTEFILKAGASHQMYKSDNQGTDYDSISYMNWCCWSIYNGFILKIELIWGLNIKCWNAKMFNKKWKTLAYEKLTDAKMIFKKFSFMTHEYQKMHFEVDTDTQKLKNSMRTIQLTSVRIKPSQKASMYVILIRK